MGCDIHIFIEKKTEQGWEQVDIPKWVLPTDRNYELFGFLSGVRSVCKGKPLMKEGLPKDMSIKKNEYWVDYHSFGHCYLDQIKGIKKSPFKGYETYFFTFFWFVLDRHEAFWRVDDRDIRILVCYDN